MLQPDMLSGHYRKVRWSYRMVTVAYGSMSMDGSEISVFAQTYYYTYIMIFKACLPS